MALFKIYKGNKENLPMQYHEGYTYFTTDTGEMFIDIDSSSDFSTGTRVQVTDSNTSTVHYAATLEASQWTQSGEDYVYNYTNTELVAKVPPIVTYTSNLEEYSKIDHADATPSEGIVFTSPSQPVNDIGIIIIDVK